jgi:UDP-galactopyranose mutase
MSSNFDYLIVGAGLAGMTLAERIATQLGRRVAVIDRRGHIGGNCHDGLNDHGVLTHTYGPHYFRTNSPKIKNYLSQFTEWTPASYLVNSYSYGRHWSFPVNLKTFCQLVGRTASQSEFEHWLNAQKIKIENPQNSEEAILSQVGDLLYKQFYLGYTLKQWKRHPKDLDASVCARIPVRTTADDRYFSDDFQALPALGYTRLFESMLRAGGGGIQLFLNSDYEELKSQVKYKQLIYTGAIDEYYHYCYGELPYRSLRFEPRSFTRDQIRVRGGAEAEKGLWQHVLQINYPNDYEYTRSVEVKHVTGQKCENTTVVYEYPADYLRGRERYYPIPAPDTKKIYSNYLERSKVDTNVRFVGRLATYKYYNMDQVVAMALSEFEDIKAFDGMNPRR